MTGLFFCAIERVKDLRSGNGVLKKEGMPFYKVARSTFARRTP